MEELLGLFHLFLLFIVSANGSNKRLLKVKMKTKALHVSLFSSMSLPNLREQKEVHNS